MPLVPDTDRAILDIRKIADYCLDPAHPRGRHQARVLREALGLGQADAEWLRDVLLDGLRRSKTAELTWDDFGSRWRVDVPVTRHGKSIVVRTV
jgi:hypothetical protein